jgi:RNA polymerase sigma-70 factor, ECF subfamily
VREPTSGDHVPDLLDRLDVRRAVAPLDARDRGLLALRYVADLTQPQIAQALGMPEGSMKVRLHRLRKRLRR